MFFALITFIAAFMIEGIGTVVSVIGLSTLFGANPIIIALAVALDIGKLVVVTLLYKFWKTLGYTMRAYGLVAAVVTMTITSAGAGGYLSGEFQKAIMGTQEGSLKVDVLKGQIAKYEERKKQIDDQIAKIPEKYSATQRIRLMNQFKQEQQDLQVKIAEIDKQLPELQVHQIGVEAKAGPILYIAKAFQIPVEQAVKWVILMIIIVFDPLAVFLIIAGNFLWEQFQTRKKETKLEEQLEKFDSEKHGGEFEEQSLQNRIEVAQKVFSEPHDPVDDWVTNHPKFVPAEVEPEPETGGPNRPMVMPEALANYPDTRLTKTYTRDDLIAAGCTDEQLIEAGYEPREPAPEAAIEAEPAEPEVAPAVVPEPAPEAAEKVAEQPMFITREEMVAQHEATEARKAGMSLEEWRAAQLKRLDEIQAGVKAVEAQLKPREQITLSSLGLVRADPNTIADVQSNEIGLGALDPTVRPDIYRQR